MVFGVINLGEHHIDGKLLLITLPQVPPLIGGHLNVGRGPPVHLNWTQAGLSPFPSATLHNSVVG